MSTTGGGTTGKVTTDINDALFKAAFESAPNGIVIIDVAGKIISTNAQIERIFGYQKFELENQPIEVLLPIRFRAGHFKLREEFTKNPQPRPMGANRELFGQRKDGTEFPLEIGLTPIATSVGVMVLSVIVDITRRRAVENALRESERRARDLAAIVESTEDAIIGCDLDGTVTSWNSSAERIFGPPATKMIGTSIFRIAAPNYEAELKKMVLSVSEGKRADHYNTLCCHSNGSTLNISLSVSPVFDLSARMVGLSGVARDVTKSMRSEAALKASQTRLQKLQAELQHVSRLSAVGEMASTLAHEINQPLAAISNYLTGMRRLLAANYQPVPAKIDEAMEKAAAQAIRAGQIIRRLRHFVTRKETERRPENLEKMVEDALALSLIGHQDKDVVLRLELSPGAHVFADRLQIQQVLVHLVRNALEAMGDCEKRELTIRSEESDEGAIEIVIADSGKGVDQSVREQLFHPFFTTKVFGMGLGLTISRSIVEAHGGLLDVDLNCNDGATFKLKLPKAFGPTLDS